MPPKNNNPHGTSAEQRRKLKSLALEWRGEIDFADLRKRLVSFAQGIDPSNGSPVDPKVSLMAINMLLDRTHGQAAQFVVVDAAVRSESSPDTAPRFQGMTMAEIQAKRQALIQAGATRAPRIISVNVPSASGDDDEV